MSIRLLTGRTIESFIRKRPFFVVVATICDLVCDSEYSWLLPFEQPEAVHFLYLEELCGASAQGFDFFATTKNCSFHIGKLRFIGLESPEGY